MKQRDFYCRCSRSLFFYTLLQMELLTRLEREAEYDFTGVYFSSRFFYNADSSLEKQNG